MIDWVPSALVEIEYRSGPLADGTAWASCTTLYPAGDGADQIVVPVGKELWDRTVTCSCAVTLSALAVSVTWPAARPVTTAVPLAFVVTVAMPVLLTVQVASVRGIPRLSTAVNCWVPPITRLTTAGVICKENGRCQNENQTNPEIVETFPGLDALSLREITKLGGSRCPRRLRSARLRIKL